MGDLLDKNSVLFERTGDGKLIPQIVSIIGTDDEKKIKMVPMDRGEILEHLQVSEDGDTSEDADKWIVLNKIVEPKFTEEEFAAIPKGVVDNLVLTVIKASGLVATKKSFGIESEIKKKSHNELKPVIDAVG